MSKTARVDKDIYQALRKLQGEHCDRSISKTIRRLLEEQKQKQKQKQ